MEQMYSLKSAAELLDVSVKTLRRLIHSSEVKIYRVGSNIRIKESDLKNLVNEVPIIDEIL